MFDFSRILLMNEKMELTNRTIDCHGGWLTGPTHAIGENGFQTLCGVNTGNPITQHLWTQFGWEEGVVGCERCKRVLLNIVVETDEKKCWDYEYQAKYFSGSDVLFLASNSLVNLKKGVRDRGWDMAWITTKTGCLSYGQNLVDEYPYRPRN